MLFLRFHRDHDDDDHDDQGGLHRDLLETGAAMDRRRMLRTTAKFGVALGAIPLISCASDGTSITGTEPNNGTDTTGGTANCVSRIPRRDCRASAESPAPWTAGAGGVCCRR